MRNAMANAEVGDDVYGEDPTVDRLEETIADRLGKQAAVFVPSGTQSNLIALLSHCERGDEYIVGQHAHTYRYEGGGAAVLGSIQPQPIDFTDDGTLPLDKVAAAIKPDDPHCARTRLVCLENTQDGKVLPLEYVQDVATFARDRQLSLHLDGARLFNAAIALQVPAARLAQFFDTVSVCFSKGLGAPVGSALVGPAEFIERARRWRKVAGGGWRQAGIVAAGALHALEHHVERLADDHRNARRLAEMLDNIDGLEVATTPTNMVFVRPPDGRQDALVDFLAARQIRVSGRGNIRLVTHLDVDAQQIDAVAAAFKTFFEE